MSETLWVPVERLQPIIARYTGDTKQLPFRLAMKIFDIQKGRQRFVKLDKVDELLYTLDLDIWLRYRKEDGGLADIYFDGAQYGNPNRKVRPERRKYASPEERARIRGEKVQVECHFCGTPRMIRRDSLSRGLRSRCKTCRHLSRPPKRWTRETIVDAIHAWTREHGRTPGWNDWAVSTSANPSSQTVRSLFGGWNKAIEEAGYEPRPVGYQRKAA